MTYKQLLNIKANLQLFRIFEDYKKTNMKKLLIIIIAASTIACKNEPPVDYAIISGTVLNTTNPKSLSINALDRSFTKTLEITSEGGFVDTLKTNIKDYVLYDGQNPVFLYVKAGDNIAVNYDVKDFESTLQITGEGSKISNYLVEKRAIEKEKLGGKKDFYTFDETAYKELFNTIADSQIEVLEKTAGIPEEYIAKEKRNINYFYLSMLADYEGAHKYYARKQNFKVSDGFLTELETIDYNDGDDYESSVYYKKLVNNHFNLKAKEVGVAEGLTGGMALIKAVDDITDSKLKNGLLFDYASNNLTREKDLKGFYNAFIASSTNEEQKNKITEAFNKLKATNVGESSPKFVNYENNAGGTTSLDDLKGKYVYIDVWATWCGPCIKEIPALKEVEKQFHGKNIEFVSISIDKKKDYEKWKKMIVDKDLKGMQLIADNDWKSSFIQDYSITGIPRFILIDPAGNIVNANAPRPSSPGLVSLIESLKI